MAICVTQLLSCDSLGLYPARLLCPWDSPGKKTGMGCHAFLQGIFLGIDEIYILLYFSVILI